MKRGKKPIDSPSSEVPGVDLAQLERLLAFMSQHGLEEFEYAYGDLRIRLKKAVTCDPGPRMLPRAEVEVPKLAQRQWEAPPGGDTPVPETPAQSVPRSPVAGEAGKTAKEAGLHLIKSPIVGTFYSAASPGAPPFVNVGDRIELGQVVCIVEAMKLMNEIEADVSGEVVQVFLENGQPVEYGEPLFGIRAAAKK